MNKTEKIQRRLKELEEEIKRAREEKTICPAPVVETIEALQNEILVLKEQLKEKDSNHRISQVPQQPHQNVQKKIPLFIKDILHFLITV